MEELVGSRSDEDYLRAMVVDAEKVVLEFVML